MRVISCICLVNPQTKQPSGFLLRSAERMSIHRSTHSSQTCTFGPAISLRTSFAVLLQNEHLKTFDPTRKIDDLKNHSSDVNSLKVAFVHYAVQLVSILVCHAQLQKPARILLTYLQRNRFIEESCKPWVRIWLMPTVLRIDPYRFFFVSLDSGEPRHVHV
jgi:hypothetical protein